MTSWKEIFAALSRPIHQAVGKVQIRFPDSAAPSGHRQDGRRSADPGQPAGDRAERRQPDASVRDCTVAKWMRSWHGRRRDVGGRACSAGRERRESRFLSEKLRDIEQERGAIALRTVDVKRIFNDALRESFDPLPRVSLHGTMTVTSGLKIQSGSAITSLAGEHNAIQTVVEFVIQ